MIEFKTNNGLKIESTLSIDELWENTNKALGYTEGTDASHLIGADYLSWNGNKMLYHEMKLIKIRDITESSESLKKVPVYKDQTTQAPPVDVSCIENGKYRLFNGHRRYASAKARKEKEIFAEIIHIVTIVRN